MAFKCPNCNGKKEYITEACGIEYPVKCDMCDEKGKVSRSEFYRFYYRKPYKMKEKELQASSNK